MELPKVYDKEKGKEIKPKPTKLPAIIQPKLTRDVTLAQSNMLTQSRYDFSVVEKRAIYFIISEVRKQFIDKTDGQRDLFENLVVRIQTGNLTKADMELKEVYGALKRLRAKSIWIEDEKQILEVGYINYFKHVKREPYLEVEVSKMILPYLVELAAQFTTYSLTVAISLKAKYSQRFYEYCSQYEFNDQDPNHEYSGYFFATVKDMRRKMMLEDMYPRYALFKKYVIDTAQKELKMLYEKEQSNLYFEYKEEKYGRTVDKLHFYVYSRNMKKMVVGAKNLMDLTYYIKLWLETWLAAKKRPKNQQWINDVMNKLNLRPDNIPKLYKRLEKLKKEEPAKNHAALARHIIEEDYMV
jgi:plasmid replication initiation protein